MDRKLYQEPGRRPEVKLLSYKYKWVVPSLRRRAVSEPDVRLLQRPAIQAHKDLMMSRLSTKWPTLPSGTAKERVQRGRRLGELRQRLKTRAELAASITAPRLHVYSGAGNPDNIRGLVVRPSEEEIQNQSVKLKTVIGYFETGEFPSAAARYYWQKASDYAADSNLDWHLLENESSSSSSSSSSTSRASRCSRSRRSRRTASSPARVERPFLDARRGRASSRSRT